jgi:hypothetical protein
MVNARLFSGTPPETPAGPPMNSAGIVRGNLRCLARVAFQSGESGIASVHRRGPGTRAWVQRAERQNKPVTELRTTFKEPPFPGFLGFLQALSTVDKLPKDWITSLRNARGVYLLTCPNTKEQYVGSATGHDGFWLMAAGFCAGFPRAAADRSCAGARSRFNRSAAQST